MIQAFYQAPASSLSPFVYLQMIWATSLGWLIFDQLPDGLTFVGMGIIALSGSLIVVYRRYTNARGTSEGAAQADPTAVRPEG